MLLAWRLLGTGTSVERMICVAPALVRAASALTPTPRRDGSRRSTHEYVRYQTGMAAPVIWLAWSEAK